MKYAYLENTSGGHNKFYEMIEDASGNTWTARWGKIGASAQSQTYPISDWYKKYDEKIKKGYVDLTNSSPRAVPPKPPKPKFETNKKHLEKINQVLTVLNVNKDDIERSHEYIRDVDAIRKTIKDPKSKQKGALSKEDMIYLNDLWKKIKHYAGKDD